MPTSNLDGRILYLWTIENNYYCDVDPSAAAAVYRYRLLFKIISYHY